MNPVHLVKAHAYGNDFLCAPAALIHATIRFDPSLFGAVAHRLLARTGRNADQPNAGLDAGFFSLALRCTRAFGGVSDAGAEAATLRRLIAVTVRVVVARNDTAAVSTMTRTLRQVDATLAPAPFLGLAAGVSLPWHQ